MPKGKRPEDVYIFGLFNADSALVGMISAVKHYPDNQIWWLGLMMLAPNQRRQGLGADFYRAFRRWVSAQGSYRISLSAIEENKPGLQFWQQMGLEVIQKIPSRHFKTKVHNVYVLSQVISGTGSESIST